MKILSFSDLEDMAKQINKSYATMSNRITELEERVEHLVQESKEKPAPKATAKKTA